MHHEIAQDEIRIRLVTTNDIPFVQSFAERFVRVGILALDVFALNVHALSFYQHLGYMEETIKLIKELSM